MHAPEWAAEVAIDEALVRSLIEDQFPDLAGVSMRLLAEGWDNAVWLAGEHTVFRFPRRSIAIPGVESELRVLPALAPLLPAPVPAPTRVGRPSETYPWPFFGAPLIRGTELADAGLPDDARVGLATQLGEFLHRLHDPALASAAFAADLPVDPMGRADMTVRVERALAGLTEVQAAGLWTAPASLQVLLDDARTLPPPSTRVLVHGDLHLRHVLVDPTGRLAGVIDWGDVCLGDPALDLAIGWMAFDEAARQAFLAAYGVVPADRAMRARVLAVFLASTLATYATQEGLGNLASESLRALDRVVAA